MSTSASNVVRLLPRKLDQIEQSARDKYRCREIDKDRQSLKDLSLHLRSLRRDLTVEVGTLDAAGILAAEHELKLQANDLIEQVEALEAGINKLIGAFAAHQPR
jgi:hypothetical protein